jgi:hypothetical protein
VQKAFVPGGFLSLITTSSHNQADVLFRGRPPALVGSYGVGHPFDTQRDPSDETVTETGRLVEFESFKSHEY